MKLWFFLGVFCHLVLVLISQHICENQYQLLGPIKFSLNLHLFLWAFFFFIKKQIQKNVFFIFALIFSADLFFVFLGSLPGMNPEMPVLKLFGVIFFSFAYLSLIRWAKFWAQSHVQIRYLWPFLTLAAVVFFLLCFKLGRFLPGVFIFNLFMVGMASQLLSAGFKMPNDPRGKALVMAGVLFFLSEMAFVVANFYPGFTRNDPWMANMIWATYIPGWANFLGSFISPSENKTASL